MIVITFSCDSDSLLVKSVIRQIEHFDSHKDDE